MLNQAATRKEPILTETNWGKSKVKFIPGLRLSQLYYEQVITPLLQLHEPDLEYSAGLVGYGSDVLGFDTPMSRDHMWGPRLVLFLSEEAYDTRQPKLNTFFRRHLPVEFLGYPTGFGPPDQEGVRLLQRCPPGAVDHLIQITTPNRFLKTELGCDLSQPLSAADWLTFPEQKLLAVTSGAIFHDQLGFEALRTRLRYFPKDVWLYLMASQWMRVSQEEPFIGRTGENGDELGSRVITARMAENLMRLAFLQHRQYAPYSKWFGTAFQALPDVQPLSEELNAALAAELWKTRENHLCAAYLHCARLHNQLKLTKAIEPTITQFHGRPYRVLGADRFAHALQSQIKESQLRQTTLHGSLNQFANSTDLLENPELCRKIKTLFE